MAGRFAKRLIEELEARIGHTFRTRSLLRRALTHSAPTGEPQTDNERLEFVGDRVLGLVLAEELFRRFPKDEEGTLARRINSLVSKTACARVASRLDIASVVCAPGKGGAVSQRALADICEALIAAIYFDAGLEAAREFVLRHWQDDLVAAEGARRDPKSQLQEWALAWALPVPAYAVSSREGPDHAPLFTVEVTVEGHAPVTGEGATKREAEQAAAEAFLKRMGISRA